MNEHSSGTRAEVHASVGDSGTPEESLRIIRAALKEECRLMFTKDFICVETQIPTLHGCPEMAYGHIAMRLTDECQQQLRRAFHALATGTDSTRSGDQIKPDVADQGSVRNATDMRERCAKLVDEYAHRSQCVDGLGDWERCDPCLSGCGDKERAIAKAIRALPVLEAAKD